MEDVRIRTLWECIQLAREGGSSNLDAKKGEERGSEQVFVFHWQVSQLLAFVVVDDASHDGMRKWR
jgi:hypothetical protein